jgi:hypothetical protein
VIRLHPSDAQPHSQATDALGLITSWPLSDDKSAEPEQQWTSRSGGPPWDQVGEPSLGYVTTASSRWYRRGCRQGLVERRQKRTDNLDASARLRVEGAGSGD